MFCPLIDSTCKFDQCRFSIKKLVRVENGTKYTSYECLVVNMLKKLMSSSSEG